VGVQATLLAAALIGAAALAASYAALTAFTGVASLTSPTYIIHDVKIEVEGSPEADVRVSETRDGVKVVVTSSRGLCQPSLEAYVDSGGVWVKRLEEKPQGCRAAGAEHTLNLAPRDEGLYMYRLSYRVAGGEEIVITLVVEVR
jgi:hypothetical protein